METFDELERIRARHPSPPAADSAVEREGMARFEALFSHLAPDRVQGLLGIDYVRANVLEVDNGVLTGRMVDQPWGDSCDGEEKRRTLLATCAQLSINPLQAIAVGDGANDLPMMGAAGLSVAYHAKPTVRAQAMVAINEGGLDRLLELVN